MTNNLAAVQVTIVNGAGVSVDMADAALRWHFEITSGLDDMAPLRGPAGDMIPYRRGQTPVVRYADPRPLVLDGWVFDSEAGIADYRTNVDTLKRLLSPKLGPLTMILLLEDGSTRRFEQCVFQDILPAAQEARGVRECSIEVLALDPYMYTDFPGLRRGLHLHRDRGLRRDSAGTINVVPNADPYYLPIDTFGTSEVERVAVTFTGPSVGVPGIRVLATGVGFVMTYALTGGQSITVDNDLGTCVDQDGANKRAEMILLAANSLVHGARLVLPAGACTLRVAGHPTSVSITLLPTYE